MVDFVHISITVCPDLERISVLSRLPHLKSLKLWWLDSVEYMEDSMSNSSNDVKAVAIAKFFPSLESLEILGMEKLKGWWKGELPGMRLIFPRLAVLDISLCPNFTSLAPFSSPQELPSLRTLKIAECPSLTSNLICPTLEKLTLRDAGESWLITCANSQENVVKLRDVRIDKVVYLNSLPTNILTRLLIDSNTKMGSVLEVEEAFQRCAFTLRTLEITNCENLSRLSGLEHLTALEELTLCDNDKLSIREEDEEPWKSFHQTLRQLKFNNLPEMKIMPIGMQHLTSLQFLELWKCKNIKSLPEAIKDLTSLKKLSIRDCPGLEERCRKPNGEDFLKIKHILEIEIDG